MSSLPSISPRGHTSQNGDRVPTPRRDLVNEYTIKRKAHEEKLAKERQALLDEAAARNEAERRRKMQFKADIESQMESQRRLRDSHRQEQLSPTRGSIMQTVTDEASNKQLARQKAREALHQSELALKERNKQKQAERDREQNEEAALHQRLQEERAAELEADRLKRKALADAMERDRIAAEQQKRSRSKEREAKLKEERAMASRIAELDEKQRHEDDERARYEKRVIATVNADVARHSGRQSGAEKAAEREMRKEYEEAEKQRRHQEQEAKAAAKLRLRRELEMDASKRHELCRTHSTERSLTSSAINSPRKETNNAARAAAEVNAVKDDQHRRQQEYRVALEQQILEHTRRHREEIQQ
jgi:hypothetical protein